MSVRSVDRGSAGRKRGSAGRLAGQLGWLSIGIGAVQFIAARALARRLGLPPGAAEVVRGFGLRGLVTGAGLIGEGNRRPWVFGRVAGDAMDLAALAATLPRAGRPTAVATGLVAVAAVTVLDLITAEALRTEEVDRRRRARAVRDYAFRSGLPRGVAGSRGAANDVEPPADFRVPEPLRPWKG